MDQVREILKILDPLAKLTTLDKIDGLEQVKIVQEKTNIKPSQLAVLLSIALLLFIASFFIRVTDIFVWFICYFFPAYFTLIALREKNSGNQAKYLVYWMVYVLVWQSQGLWRLFFDRTFLNIFKVLLTVTLLHESFDFANRLFVDYLRPLLLKDSVRNVTDKVDEIAHKGEEVIE